MVFISKYFIKINVKIILIIKKIFTSIFKIILYPFKMLFNIMLKILKPISFFVINIKNTTLNFNRKQTKPSKNKKINKKMHKERRILIKNVEKYN